jgi:hypothetical protein
MMPRGKELEQLPAGNVAPGAGKDLGRYRRESLESIVQNEQPKPSDISKENEDML